MISLWKVTRVALDAAARAVSLQLRGAGDEGDDDGAEPVDDASWLQPLGLAVRPIVARTLRALGVQHGDEVAVLTAWDRARTPTDLEAGETRLYAAGEPTVRLRLRVGVLRLEGSVDLQLNANDGHNVVINSGSTPVAKEGSATAGHAHAITFVLTAPAGGGPVTGTITAAVASDTVATGAGSQRVLVP